MKTQKLLIALCFMLFGLGFNKLQAQSIDTVCAGATGVTYSVTNTSGSTYYWVVNGGTQASGGTSNSITVDWSSTTGTDTLKVVEKSAAGCFGDTVRLAVYRMPLPTAAISGTTSICYNNLTEIQVDLTGIGPWNITYSDGTNSTTVNNITSSPYKFNTPTFPTGTGSVTYTLTAVSNSFGCNGTVSGSAIITVNPKPVTSAIAH
ncbi:MAG: hypothetical protein EOP47_17695 [Sphingobacteriaceae bacterium]|nr:MAG: hypothetical protein EOP47_17695 [Sphingobacteriaceae bacterium]